MVVKATPRRRMGRRVERTDQSKMAKTKEHLTEAGESADAAPRMGRHNGDRAKHREDTQADWRA